MNQALNQNRGFFKSATVLTLILSSLTLVLISWFRAYMAGAIMVDGHALHGFPEAFVFSAFLVSLGAFSYAYYRLWKDSDLETGQLKLLAFLLVAIFSFMVPMLSNDIFSYMVFGDAADKGADVYTNAQCTHFSAFYPYITGLWTTSTCAYGTVILLMAMLATWLSAGKIVVALIIYKLMILLFAFVFIEVAAKIAFILKAPVKSFVFIVFNPVFLMQGVGQLHADLIAIAFVLFALYFSISGRWYLSFILVAFSIATKMNYVLVLPFFVFVVFLQDGQSTLAYRKLSIGLTLLLLSLATLYFPFYTSTATITTPFTFHFFQNPSKCIGEILSYVIYFAPQIIGGNHDQLQHTVNGTSGPYTQLLISVMIVKVCQVIALVASLYILTRFLNGRQTLQQWFRVYVRTLLLFLLYYLHIFNPWYLMMFLPFMWVDEDPAFMGWLFVLTCFISVQDIVCSVSRDSVVYAMVLVLTFASVMLYLYKPRRMFFTSLGY